MFQFRLLGQFDIRLDGKRVVVSSRAGQSLLAYLILTAGTAHRREKLAGMLWPDTTDENARKNLRQELWRIRKAIPAQELDTVHEYLLADEFTITFNRDADYWLDVALLERAETDLQSLTSGLSVYQGELLPGFYEDWVILERERIQTLFESKMEQFVEKLVEAERWTTVQEQCERWLALGHTPEQAYRALMLSYSARGDMAKVSFTYQRCVDDLRSQFGVEPSAETQTLYKGLLKGAKSPRRAVSPPSGTVTFLFTDIEGSMQLLDKLGDQYTASLEEHHNILRAAIQKWNGREMDTQGDSFFISFFRALDAVQCAIEVQRAIAQHGWPLNEPMRVRMGLHTGEPLIASMGYVGMDVHRAARIGAVGHGGQVLLSQTTRELVLQDLPRDIKIRELGEHRLKDMKYPTPIYQLMIDGLPNDFSPLKTRIIGTEAPTPGEPPFKGLQYFEENDADLFFGRELLTAKLVNRLSGVSSPFEGNREVLDQEGLGERLLSVIIGASGSGKSSLVRAGLIPALKQGKVLSNGTKPPEGSADWQIYIITPTAHPLEALAREITRRAESVTTTSTFMDDLTKDPRSLAFFLARKHTREHILLIIDQFEELFTLCRDEFEREAFIDNLLYATSPSAGGCTVRIIITLRADFYAYLAQYPELRDAVAHQQEYIGPMATEELRRAIEEPARRGHWEFEPGLVDLILRDVGDEPGALPLLSHALLETWKRRAGYTLTLKGYADAGGVHGAIAHTAEGVYQNLSPDEQTIVQEIFLRLTELGEGTEDTRRRASFDELLSNSEDVDQIRSVLNRLADARLVTLGENLVEVAHEALIREWPTLREWLNQDRESLRLHRHLTEAAHDWELLERDQGALYRGVHLAQAREWATLHPKALNEAERVFLKVSMEQEQNEVQKQEAQQQRELEAARKLAHTERKRAEEQVHATHRLKFRNRVITTVGSIALTLSIIAFVFGMQAAAERDRADQQRNVAVNAQAAAQAEQQRAEEEKRLAKSRELAIAAINNLEVDPERSILLALQAVNQSDTEESEDALHRAVQTLRMQLTVQHSDAIEYVAYNPNGTRFATASDDGTTKVWDASTGQELLTLKTGKSAAVAFNPTGTHLATANYEAKTATIWDAATGQELLTLTGHTGSVNQVVFSSDGTRIATASGDTTAKVWDAMTGQELFTLSGHTDIVSSVAFSPDGKSLVTGSWDHTAKVWDMATGKELLTLSNFTQVVEAIFSPDGTRIVTNSGNDVQFWEMPKGEKLFTLLGHTGLIEQVVFSVDGKLLATASLDGTAKVWEVASGKELLTLAGHASSVLSVALSPDGVHLATASNDHTARVWDISLTGSHEWLSIAPHTDVVRQVVYSPDGTRLATASYDGTAKVFDALQGTELLSLSGHTARVYAIAFSPDGSRLATASEDNTTKVWNAITGREMLTLAGHGEGIVGGLFSGVLAVIFSPDGKQLATVGADGNAILWEAMTGEQLESFSNNGIGITNVAFSPDGLSLFITTDQPPATVAGEDATTQRWDLTTDKRIFTATQAIRIWGLAISNNGKRFATAGFGGIVKIRDTTTGQEVLELSGHTGTVSDVAFSPDDKSIATASIDGTAKIWDAETGKEVLTLTSNTGPVMSVSFNPDGTRLATSGQDGTVRVYLLKIEDLVALAETRLTRSLRDEECLKYLHLEQCPSQP